MRKVIGAIVVLVLCCATAFAQGGLDSFLNNLNIQARADLNGFAAKVGVQFGVPQAQVQAVIGTVREPADAFMVFQLGQFAHQPADSVVQVYQKNRGKGWGVIAKNLGIKPGSAEFHRLKRGDFALTGDPGSADNPGKGHGKGKGKGHNK